MPLPLDITYITIFVHEFLFISQCCGPARPFDMNITDNTGMEVVITNIHHTIIIFIVPDSPYMSIICLPPPPVQCVYGQHFPKPSIARKVIHLNRPLRCQACCFPCCLQELEVIIVISNGDVIVIVGLSFLHNLPLSTYNGFKSLFLALSSPLP